MIYKFWMNADYFDNIDGVVLEDSNIETILYKEYKKGWFKLAFEKGVEIDLSLLPEIKFYHNLQKGQVFSEILINVFGLTIVSESIRQAFMRNGISGIQYIPITIEEIREGEIKHGYYILNFLNVVDAINLQYSEYEYLEKYNIYTSWGNRICFEEQKISKLDIFKDKKSPKSIFVSEKVKHIFTQQNWEEANFTLLDSR